MSVHYLHERSAVVEVQMLGSFKLVSKLASSELTELYTARALSARDTTHAPYVIKRLQPHHAHDPELRALLLAAGHAAAKLHAENVLSVLEVHAEPEVFQVMNRLDGANLELLLATCPVNATRYIVPLIVDALQGLEALHRQLDQAGQPAPIVHGAPCARHIFVTADGVGRLLDLTHAIGPGLGWSARRDAWLAPGDMAPEQALAPTHVDPRCDLFIVGTLLWQALTLRPLFGAPTPDATLRNMLRMPIPSPSEAGASVGGAFDHVCFRALQRSMGQRYGSAAEMAHELREAAQRADLYATREEIAIWLQAMAQRGAFSFQHDTSAAGRRTLTGFGPVVAGVLASQGFRPMRPGRVASEGKKPAAQREPSSPPEPRAAEVIMNHTSDVVTHHPSSSVLTESPILWQPAQPSLAAPARPTQSKKKKLAIGVAAFAASVELAIVISGGADRRGPPALPSPAAQAVQAAAPAAESNASARTAASAPPPLQQAQRPQLEDQAPVARASSTPSPDHAGASAPAKAQDAANSRRALRRTEAPPVRAARQKDKLPEPRPASGELIYEWMKLGAPKPAHASEPSEPLPNNPY